MGHWVYVEKVYMGYYIVNMYTYMGILYYISTALHRDV